MTAIGLLIWIVVGTSAASMVVAGLIWFLVYREPSY